VIAGTYATQPGRQHPLGAIADAGGVNFSVFSQNADEVELLLFEHHDDASPFQQVHLIKTFYFWHIYVAGLSSGTHYAFRVAGPHGPGDPELRGHRFNSNKVLIDPYSRGDTQTLWQRGAACGPGDNLATSMRSVVVDSATYDWEGDRPLQRPMSESVIYEMHVGGFTRSPSSGSRHPGTFAGVVDKIPYLQELGVTAVELLPVMEFDETEVTGTNPLTGQPLSNFWGYSTVGFFSPHAGYCVSPEQGTHVCEFRDMVKALHTAGIEVILDVVFNHSSEGNQFGPTMHFKGFDNSVYYHLSPADRQFYMNYAGTGNTVNCNHPIVEKLIVESLAFWVEDMHVDGFRFDEGSILSRGEDGRPLAHPPVVWQVELEEALADTKVIAEAWDADGLYQIGYFPGTRWAEWNGRFRDDVRRFITGDRGMVGAVTARISGSSDLYQPTGRLPINSINFITCHDGFTLNDLVSYNSKHNDANGEANRDGNNDNLSYNCGVEGPTADGRIDEFRRRQIKNFAAVLLLSRGVPMILGGDEARRSQQGNNNAYCQDNEISWYDWQQVGARGEIFEFFKKMIGLRKRHPTLTRPAFYIGPRGGPVNDRALPDVTWHGCRLGCPGWYDPNCRVLGFTLGGYGDDVDLHIMMNMEDGELEFDMPLVPSRQWHRLVDTARPSPEDIVELELAVPATGNSYTVQAKSVVVFASR
jgi:isoamylase